MQPPSPAPPSMIGCRVHLLLLLLLLTIDTTSSAAHRQQLKKLQEPFDDFSPYYNRRVLLVANDLEIGEEEGEGEEEVEGRSYLLLPKHADGSGQGPGQVQDRKRRALDDRKLSDWQEEWQRKAATLGQSEDEIARVHYYMGRMKEISEQKHPSIGRLRGGSTNKKDTSSPPPQADDEVQRQLSSWNSRRMSDHPIGGGGSPEEGGQHYEGDIILTGDQAESIYTQMSAAATEGGGGAGRRRAKRKFIGSKVRRWDPKKPIYYSFDGSHTLREQRVIELALEHWHNISCLNFERRNDDPKKGNRIVFTDVDGCASNVGKHPLGEAQFVSLAPECIRLGVIAHEVAHALGFWHEQSRPDRDFFVKVEWQNIDRDSKGQFLKEQPADVDNGGVPYDFGSIMHYRSKAFARFDDLFTMSTFIGDYQRTIGQRDQLSFNDIRLMNNIYCRDTCPERLPCQRGGYTDPRRCDRCRCPDGFTGQLCEQVMPGYGADCGGRIELAAGDGWQRIASPGYPAEFKEGQECSWLLVASRSQHVQLQFIGDFEMYCKVRHSLCMDYVEIRNTTDFANTGMRYCCFGTPQSTVVSATEDMLVLFRSFYRGGRGFQAQVRAIAHNGGWSAWGEWTKCSAACGACGLRKRTRECLPSGAYCFGDESETEVCGRQPCRGLCQQQQQQQEAGAPNHNGEEEEDAECVGLLALLKGLRCKT